MSGSGDTGGRGRAGRGVPQCPIRGTGPCVLLCPSHGIAVRKKGSKGVSTCVCVCVHARTQVCVRACTDVCAYACACVVCAYMCVCVCARMCVYARVCVHCVCACVHVCAKVSTGHPRPVPLSCSALRGVPSPSAGCCPCGQLLSPRQPGGQTPTVQMSGLSRLPVGVPGPGGGQRSPGRRAAPSTCDPQMRGPLMACAAHCLVQGSVHLA